MAFIRYISIMVFTMALLVCLAIGASYALFPNDVRIDTAHASESLFMTEPRYLLFSLGALAHPGPRVIVLGSSNVRAGFRPEEMEPLLHRAVFNLSVGGSNIHEMAEVVQLAFTRIPKASWPEVTFLYGIFYGQFENDAHRWMDNITDLDNEGARYGLYVRDDRRLRSNMPASWLSMAEIMLRSRLLVSWFFTHSPVKEALYPALLRLIGQSPSPPDFNSYTLTPAQRQAEIARRVSHIGEVADWDDTFKDLRDLAHTIHDHGSRLVILDLPLPGDGAFHKTLYRQHLAALSGALDKMPGIAVRSMTEEFNDDDFYDLTHPRPRTTPRWARQAAEAILATESAGETPAKP